MARLTSKVLLTEYIKSQLGAPTINIEVTTTQIHQIIDDSIQKFTEYAYGTLEGTVIVQLSGAKEYNMPDTMTNLIRLSKGDVNGISAFNANYGNGFVPELWSDSYFNETLTGGIIPSIISIGAKHSLIERYLGTDIYHNFNHISKKLQILENYVGPAIIHYNYESIANDLNGLVFNHEWIKAYSKAKVKELWGNVTGKFNQTLVGSAQINYDRLISEAQDESATLEEDLLTKWSDPAPIDIA